jgi:hypothetical protein
MEDSITLTFLSAHANRNLYRSGRSFWFTRRSPKLPLGTQAWTGRIFPDGDPAGAYTFRKWFRDRWHMSTDLTPPAWIEAPVRFGRSLPGG